MAGIKLGNIFEIETPKGNAYLHFIHKDKEIGDLVRVLSGLHKERPIDFEELASQQEQYMVYFPLATANKKAIVENVGYYPVGNLKKPKYMRTKHYVKGDFLGWHIVDTDTWQRQLAKTLTLEQKQMSPWGVWNDTLLIENLVNNWGLEKWA